MVEVAWLRFVDGGEGDWGVAEDVERRWLGSEKETTVNVAQR